MNEDSGFGFRPDEIESFKILDDYFKRLLSVYLGQWAEQIDQEIMGTSTDPEPEPELTIESLYETVGEILKYKQNNPLAASDMAMMHPRTWQDILKTDQISHSFFTDIYRHPEQTLLGMRVLTDVAIPEDEIYFAQHSNVYGRSREPLGYRFRVGLAKELQAIPVEILNVQDFRLKPWMVYLLLVFSLIVLTIIVEIIK